MWHKQMPNSTTVQIVYSQYTHQMFYTSFTDDTATTWVDFTSINASSLSGPWHRTLDHISIKCWRCCVQLNLQDESFSTSSMKQVGMLLQSSCTPTYHTITSVILLAHEMQNKTVKRLINIGRRLCTIRAVITR